jgi:hypothetical protein
VPVVSSTQLSASALKMLAERGNSIMNVEVAADRLVESLGGDPGCFRDLPPNLAAAYLVALFALSSQKPERT